MADPINFNEHDLRKLLDSFGMMRDSLTKISKTMNNRDKDYSDWLAMEKKNREDAARQRKADKAAIKYERDRISTKVDTSARNLADGFALLSGHANQAIGAFDNFSRKVLAGSGLGIAVGSLVQWTTQMTDTYRKMSDIGQTFSGGLLEMSKTAALSGLSMEEYGRLLEKNSTVFAIMGRDSGQNSLFNLAKNVRQTSEKFGMFGYSMEGLDELTIEYMERMRKAGVLERLDRSKAQDSIISLAKETTALATLFGKSRQDITRTASEAMQNELFLGRQYGMTTDQLMKFNSKFQNTLTGLAAQPGEVGSLLSTMLAETSGAGTSVYTAGGRMFQQAGLPQVYALMDRMNSRLERSNSDEERDQIQAEFLSELKRVGNAAMPMLRARALDPNDAGARWGLSFFTKLMVPTAQQIAEARKKAGVDEGFTKAMLNFQNQWSRFSAEFRLRFIRIIEAITPIVSTFGKWVIDQIDKVSVWAKDFYNDFSKNGGLEKLKRMFGLLGSMFERVFSLNNQQMDEHGKHVSSFTETLMKKIDDLNKDFSTMTFQQVFDEYVKKPFKDFAWWMVKWGAIIYASYKVIGGVISAIGSKLFPSLIGTMNVRANIVNVYGSSINNGGSLVPGSPGYNSLFGRGMLGLGLTLMNGLNAPEVGSKEWADNANGIQGTIGSFTKYIAPSWMHFSDDDIVSPFSSTKSTSGIGIGSNIGSNLSSMFAGDSTSSSTQDNPANTQPETDGVSNSIISSAQSDLAKSDAGASVPELLGAIHKSIEALTVLTAKQNNEIINQNRQQNQKLGISIRDVGG